MFASGLADIEEANGRPLEGCEPRGAGPSVWRGFGRRIEKNAHAFTLPIPLPRGGGAGAAGEMSVGGSG